MSDSTFEAEKEFAVANWTLDMSSVLALAGPQEFLIRDAIPRRAISFISGPPGGGKSWLAYDLAIRVARGEPWLRRENDMGAPGRVLVINHDNPTREVARRFGQLGAKESDPIWFHTAHPTDPSRADTLRLPKQAEELELLIAGAAPDLLLLDSFRQGHTADENSSEQMAEVMRCCKRWISWGVTVVMLHHTGKAGGKLRGSGEIEASCDANVEVGEGEEGESLIAQWCKTRGWKMPPARTAVECRIVDEKGPGGVVRTRIAV